MISPVVICHTESDTEWVDYLVEYLEASSSETISIRCSSLPGYALKAQKDESHIYREEIKRSRIVIAVLTESAIHDTQCIFELGIIWALGRRVVLVIDPKLIPEEIPKLLREHERYFLRERDALIELAQKVCPGYIVSNAGRDALHRLCGENEVQEHVDEVNTEEKTLVWDNESDPIPMEDRETSPMHTLAVLKPVEELSLAKETPGSPYSEINESGIPSPVNAQTQPSAIESLNAGIAMSSCLFHRDDSDRFIKELDEPIGGFIDALGGDWMNLRGLEDIDIFNSATDNLISSLPPSQSTISHWYDLGLHVSTMLSIARQGIPKDAPRREQLTLKWHSCFNSFQFLAKEVGINPQAISQIKEMLQNLIGPNSEKDYSNLTRCMEVLKACAHNADQQ